jgi:hypothetical protein
MPTNFTHASFSEEVETHTRTVRQEKVASEAMHPHRSKPKREHQGIRLASRQKLNEMNSNIWEANGAQGRSALITQNQGLRSKRCPTFDH